MEMKHEFIFSTSIIIILYRKNIFTMGRYLFDFKLLFLEIIHKIE